MSPKNARWFSVSLSIALCTAPGCKRDKSDTIATGASSTSSPAEEPTPDRTAPGLLEGEELVFGVRLPRDLELKETYGSSALATGQAVPDDVAEYFRQRVEAKHVELDQGKIVFPDCVVKETKHRVRLEIAGQGIRTRLFVRDLERPVAKETKSEEQRWRDVGLGPRGTTVDEQLE